MDNDHNGGKENPMQNEHEEQTEQPEEQRQAAEDLVAGEPARPAPSDPGVTTSRKKRGPKTAAGKARIRLNPVRYGIHATTPVIPGFEREEDWLAHRQRILASCAPVGDLARELAERAAELMWRLKRIGRAEQAEYARINQGANELRLPVATELDKVIRYEAHLVRQLFQALHELEALKKQARGEPTPLARLDVNLQTG